MAGRGVWPVTEFLWGLLGYDGGQMAFVPKGDDAGTDPRQWSATITTTSLTAQPGPGLPTGPVPGCVLQGGGQLSVF